MRCKGTTFSRTTKTFRHFFIKILKKTLISSSITRFYRIFACHIIYIFII